jgi:hypothetical protein
MVMELSVKPAALIIHSVLSAASSSLSFDLTSSGSLKYVEGNIMTRKLLDF